MSRDRVYGFEGAQPHIHEDARVARDSTLVGDVAVAADASVWPGVILRGDVGPVRVGERSHIGDNAVLHASSVGENVMVGHGALLNDAAVGDDCLVGFNATLNSDVEVGDGSIVASGTTVPEEYQIPEDSFVRGVPARVTPISETTVDPDEIFEEHSSGAYTNLAKRHDELFR